MPIIPSYIQLFRIIPTYTQSHKPIIPIILNQTHLNSTIPNQIIIIISYFAILAKARSKRYKGSKTYNLKQYLTMLKFFK